MRAAYSRQPMLATFRIAAIIAVTVLGISSLAGCGGADTRRMRHMDQGREYFQEGNFEKARVEFRNALQIAPEDAEARLMNGRVAERLGDIRQAAGMYQGAIDVDPANTEARAHLGRMLVFGGAAQRALEVVEPGLASHPDDAELLTVRGAARVQLKDGPGALADAKRAVELAPNSENAVALLASLYRQAGETSQAIELLNTTLTQLPKSIELRQVLANLYLSAQDQARAEEQLRKVIELEPTKLAHRYQLARLLTATRRIDDADRVMQEAMKAVPDSDEAKLVYVEFISSQRSREAAEKTLREFAAANPKKYGLQLGLATFQQRGGKTADAIETYRAVVARDGAGPDGLTARNRIAAIHAAQGRYDEARKLIEEVLQKNPRDNDALTLRGNILLENGDAAAAVADLRAVLRDQPNAVNVRRVLARAHLASGETGLAEENLRAAAAAAPTDIAVRTELAQLLVQTQHVDEAAELLEKSVHDAPTDPAAREALVRFYISTSNLEAARTAAADLQTLRPDLPAGPYLSGLIAQAQKRPGDAAQEFEKALQIQPGAPDVLAALAKLHISQGASDKAFARVREAVDAEPKNGVVRNLLGELYFTAKRYPDAVEQLTQASQLAPKWWLPYRNLALTKLATNDMAGGIAAYESGVKATDRSAVLVTELAALYERQGRIDDAIREYEALHARSPQLELAANNLAMLLVTYKQDKPSLDRARDLTVPFATSANGSLLDTHGWVLFKRREYAEALPVLERAAERAPQSQVIRYHLGMAQLEAGQHAKARSSLEAAVSGNTRYAGVDEARSALAQLDKRAG